MAQISRAAFAASLAALVNDNVAGEITPARLRAVLTDLEDSAVWWTEVGAAAALGVQGGGAAALTWGSAAPAEGDLVAIGAGGAAEPAEAQDIALLPEAGTVTAATELLATALEKVSIARIQAVPAERLTFAPGGSSTVSSGTRTLAFAGGPLQQYTNGGAHTLAAPTDAYGSIWVDVTNGSGAGAITFSGFAVTENAAALTTTDGHRFRIYVERGPAGAVAAVRALQ